jgi:hypothetical protein
MQKMDTRTFAATLLKVAGLVIVIHALSQFPNYLPAPWDPQATYSVTLAIMSASVNVLPPILLGSILWFFPGKVANRIIVPEAGVEAIPLAGVERVAVTTLGLFLVAWGVSDLVYQVALYFQIRDQNYGMYALPRMLSAFVQFSAGAVFVLGAKGIVRWLQSMR